jgi:hypothetical protein
MGFSVYATNEWEEETVKTADIGTAPSAVTSNIGVPNFVGVPSPMSPTLKASSPLSKRAGIKDNNIAEKNKQGLQDEQAERHERAKYNKRRVLLEKRAAFESSKGEGLPLDAESPIGSCFGKPSTEDINQLDFQDYSDL